MVVAGSTAEAGTVVVAAGKYLPQPTERHERPAAQTAGRFVLVQESGSSAARSRILECAEL
jgi:hypothetical protein